jgi:hypothetical protein
MPPVTAHVRRVIHVDDDSDRTATYVGPERRQRGFGASPFACPAHLGDSTRLEIRERYRQWLVGQPALLERARCELRGKTLACWHWPQKCHADTLAELVNDTPQ